MPSSLVIEKGYFTRFFNIFQLLELGPFSDEAARALIASSPIPFLDADVPWLLEQSGRWPCLLQILCQVRLAALEDGDECDWKEAGLQQMAPFRYLLQ